MYSFTVINDKNASFFKKYLNNNNNIRQIRICEIAGQLSLSRYGRCILSISLKNKHKLKPLTTN